MREIEDIFWDIYDVIKTLNKDERLRFKDSFIHFNQFLRDDYENEDADKGVIELLESELPRCKKCRKDISNLVFNKGENVIFKIIKGNLGQIEFYCKECIKAYEVSNS